MAGNPVNYMRRVRATNRRELVSPFGRSAAYGQGDPNSFPSDGRYDESMFFNGSPVALTGALSPSAIISQAAGPPVGYHQNDRFITQALPNFALGVQLVLNYNPKRIALTLQNQDPAIDLYFNLNAPARYGSQFIGVKLVAGQGYTFDNGCVPCDPVYVAWSTAGGIGIVMEGTRA